MSRFMNPRYSALEEYIPGEQPKGEFIKLNANENPYPPSAAVLEAVRGAEGAALNMYPDAACRELDSALAALLGLEPENILCANGSDDILNFCFITITFFKISKKCKEIYFVICRYIFFINHSFR